MSTAGFDSFRIVLSRFYVGPIPNDILSIINPVVLVLLIPAFDKIIYPTLRRYRIKFESIQRITAGFFMAAVAMAWSTIVQHLIYSAGPNYNYAVEPCSTCQKFNNLTVAWQIPSHIFLSISEIFVGITGLEYAFTKAPPTMKSIVASTYLCAVAAGSAASLALVPVSVDPNLVWMYMSLAIVSFIVGIVFYVVFREKAGKEALPVEATLRRASILSIRQNW